MYCTSPTVLLTRRLIPNTCESPTTRTQYVPLVLDWDVMTVPVSDILATAINGTVVHGNL